MKVCIKGAAEEVKVGDIQEVCLDFDRFCWRLTVRTGHPRTQYAVTLAKTFDARIKAIYVDTGWRRSSTRRRSGRRHLGGRPPLDQGPRLAKIMAERNGVPVEVEVIQGGVAKRIVRAAEDCKADMIVLGETGRTGLKRLGHGQCRRDRSRGAPIPVLVAKSTRTSDT